MDNQINSTINNFNNKGQEKNIFVYSSIFLLFIIISFIITFSIYYYNKKIRNIQTPFFTAPYISLLIEIFSTIILLSAGIYFLIYY